MYLTEKKLLLHLSKFCDQLTDILTEELPAGPAKAAGLRLRDFARELQQEGSSRRWTPEQRNAQSEKIRNAHARKSLDFMYELTCSSTIGSKRELGVIYLQHLHDVSKALGVTDTSMYNYLSRTSWDLEKQFRGVSVQIKRYLARDLPKGFRVTPSTGQNIIQILYDEGYLKEKETYALMDVPTPRGRPKIEPIENNGLPLSPHDEPAYVYTRPGIDKPAKPLKGKAKKL